MSDYGERLRKAKRDWDAAHDPETLSWAAVARLCAPLLDRGVVHPETVRLWAGGKQEPTLDEFRALGTVLEKDPVWLAFGRYPEEPTPDEPTISYGEETQLGRPPRRGK